MKGDNAMNELRFFLGKDQLFILKQQASIPRIHDIIEFQSALYTTNFLKVCNIVWNTAVPDSGHTLVVDIHCYSIGSVTDTAPKNSVGLLKEGVL